MTETAISNINSAGSPTVTALANGTFVVAWQTTVDGNVGLVGRIYDADHNPISAEFSIETTGAGTQSSVGLVALDSGGFLAVWQSADGQEPDTSGNGVRARAFTDTGVPVGDDYTINATVTGNQNVPTGVTLDDGRILLAWQSADAEGSDSSETGIRAVILNADGSSTGSEFVVNTVTEAGQLTPSVAALADGGYVIAWTSNDTAGSDTSGGVIRATHFDANGEVVGTADFEVNSTTNGAQSNVKIAALADGGYVITWRSADGADSDIRARVFDANGTATGDDFVANSTTAGNQLTPSITTLDDGRFFMVWSSAESPAVIRGRVFESDGAPVGEDFVVNSTQGTTAALPTVSTLDDGNVVVTWRTTLSGVSTVMAKTLDLTDYVGNHAPTELALSASQVDENAPDGTVVGILSAADSDGDALTYTLTDDADGLFSLVTESGETRLVVSGALDYETAATHDVTVKVADGRGGEVTKTFSVTVADVDDTDPVDPPEQRGTITIDASGSNGMDFETFVRGGFVSDVSSGGFPVFDNSAAFSGEEMFIGYGTDSTSKYVLAHGDLQYAFGTHTVAGTIGTIEYGTRGSGSYDVNGYFIGGNVALRITGLDLANAVPTNSTEEAAIEATGEVHNFASAHMTSTQSRLDLYADQLDEYAQHFIGSAGSDVYVGTRFDDTIESKGGSDLFGGGAGTDTVVFAGSRTGYTITENSNGTIAITNKASGATTVVDDIEFARFSGKLVDLETGEETGTGDAPTNIALSASSVKESASVGATVATLSATDADSTAFTYSLVNDADGAFKITGNKLVVGKSLDYETVKNHAIVVKVTDEGGNSFEKSFTIGVQNVNEAPADVAISKASVAESAAVGTVIGTLSAKDPEGGAVTYSLSSNPGGIFKVVGNQLQLAKAVDYETAKSHAVTVVAKDSAGNSTSKALSIKVTNADEAPAALALSKTSVAEDAKAGTVIGKLSAKDPEGGAVTYSLASNPGGIFKLSGNTLQLAKGVDYETAKSHSVKVVATDVGGKTTTKSFGIDVINVNENPTSIALSKASVAENSKTGTTVGTFSAKDPEGTALSYKLTDTAGGLFKLSGTKLVVAKAIDYEKVQSDQVTVRVTDDDGKSMSKTFTIKISDVVETINGTSKSETLKGGVGADLIKAGSGSDKLYGNAGADVLKGEGGNDTLYGGKGADDLYGGSGKDVFVFKAVSDSTSSSRDTIFDFGSGDIIDLKAIDANATKSGNQAFSFIGTDAFSDKAGELRYAKSGSNTYVTGDTDGDGKTDFAIHIDKAITLDKGDFSAVMERRG